MKLDFMKVFNIIGIAMTVVEKVKGAKGKEKETAVIEGINEALPDIEAAAGVDFVNNDQLRALMAQYLAARVALANGIAAAKQLKPANG